ncbi:MAG: YkvA family protein [Syntrophaceticus sp.]
MRDPNVPQEAKYTAIAALLYFVSPIDLISDILPGGYVDDGVVLALAVKAVKEILVRHQYNISAGASGMHDMGDDETDRTDAGNRCRDSSFAHETGGV